jgi:4-amino-4-deoxy-L-arabinose transferase-like glycosyltransferase
MLLLLALVKGLVWTLALPPWYGPDEPSHFMYTQLIAEEGKFPGYGGRADGKDSPQEVLCSEFNLGWRITGPFYSEPLWNGDPAPCNYPRNAATRRPPVLTNPSGGYSPLYYVLGTPFYYLAYQADVETRLHAVRLLSVLLGVLATWFMYLGAMWAFGRRRHLAIASAAIFMFQPMASQQFALANNDALLLAAAAFFFWRLFKALHAPVSPADIALLGLGVGVAYLAKPQGVFLGALLPLVLWADWKRTNGSWARVLRVSAGLAGASAMLLVAGLLVNLAIHGTVFPQGTAPPPGQHYSAKGYYELHAATNFARLYWLWVTGFWGYFGWFSIALPLYAFYTIVLVELAAVVGTVVAFVRRRVGRRILVGATLAVLAIGLLTQALEVYFFRQSGALILQGRSFLPILPAAAVVLTAGLTALGPSRCERVFAAVVVAAAFALNLGALMVLLEGFYG